MRKHYQNPELDLKRFLATENIAIDLTSGNLGGGDEWTASDTENEDQDTID